MHALRVFLCVALMAVTGGLFAQNSELPDFPVEPRSQAEVETLLAPYAAKAKATFPNALRRFERAKETDKPGTLIVIIQTEGTDGEILEIGINVEDVTPTGIIQGKVIAAQFENSPFETGDPLGIVASDVYDWGYRAKGKSTEGFLVRRASTALKVGAVAVFFQLQADKKGRLVFAQLTRAFVPGTTDEVADLLPAHVESEGRAHLFEFYQDERVPARFIEASLLYTFPEGVLVPNAD